MIAKVVMVVFLIDFLRMLRYKREGYCKMASVSRKRTCLKKKFRNFGSENFSCDVGVLDSRW